MQVLFKGQAIHTSGNLPTSKAPDFKLVDKDLNDRALSEFKGKKKIFATVPSLDTGVCSTMTKRLNEFGKEHPEVAIIVVSADLPFAQKRFCEAEKVNNVHTFSMMRNKEFGLAYGLLIQDGPLAGLLARSLFILDENDQIIHSELVGEITQEPNYSKAFERITK